MERVPGRCSAKGTRTLAIPTPGPQLGTSGATGSSGPSPLPPAARTLTKDALILRKRSHAILPLQSCEASSRSTFQ